MKKLIALLLIIIGSTSMMNAQVLTNKSQFTHQDTLRGSITPERAWWDITYYDLQVKVEPDEKFISGSNVIYYKVLNS